MQDAFVIEVAGANQYDGLGSFARSGYLSLTVVNDTANVLTGGLQLSTSANVYSTVAFAAPVPEPQGYALLVAGLGLVGAFARRRTVVAVQG
ncbi:MAG: PEP-CTERM sorting domain-containing protein [Rhodoferax sp.]|nr:PEP-CTERM sorting domain-containing protein [Rhodoferax sp.]